MLQDEHGSITTWTESIDVETHGPLYQHDCSACIYVGTIATSPKASAENSMYDLYFCLMGSPTEFVARYGHGAEAVLRWADPCDEQLANHLHYPPFVAYRRFLRILTTPPGLTAYMERLWKPMAQVTETARETAGHLTWKGFRRTGAISFHFGASQEL